MRRFSITEAGFSGYRLLAARPGLALWWLVFSLVVTMASIAALVWLAGPQMTAMRQIQDAGPGAADPATMMELSRQMLRYQAFALVFPWVVGAITIGAVVRAMLPRGSGALGYLAFGADELRLLVTTLVTGLLIGGVYLITLVVGVIVLAVNAGPGAMRAGMAHLPPAALWPAVVIGLVGAAAMIFLIIKLSLAGAQTVADKGIRIFSSWTITKGHFWSILGAYLLALLPVLVGYCVNIAVLIAVNPNAAGGGSPMHMMRAMQPDVSSMSAAFQPGYLMAYAIGAVVRTLGMAALIAPGVVILKALRTDGVADAFGDDDDDD